MAAISLVDEDRQWFKAAKGIEDEETPREDGSCAHAVTNPSETMIVRDATEDERFADNPLVLDDPNIRFYAGSRLVTPEGRGLGTVCAIDDEPRDLDEGQQRALEAVCRMVMTQLELRRRSLELRSRKEGLEEITRELERSNGELDRFASVVTHELEDPLGQVVSNLDLLELTIGDELDEASSELLENAMRGGERMNELIHDLLRYSRAGIADSERQELELDRIVEEVRGELSSEIDEAGVTVTADELPQAWGDPSLIRQCVQNLVQNAIQYRSDEDPRVHLTGSTENGHVRVEVQDNGIGIPEGEQEGLLEVFTRCSNTGDRSGTGVGQPCCNASCNATTATSASIRRPARTRRSGSRCRPFPTANPTTTSADPDAIGSEDSLRTKHAASTPDPENLTFTTTHAPVALPAGAVYGSKICTSHRSALADRWARRCESPSNPTVPVVGSR